MRKTKIMLYGDSWKATSGYGKVLRELATRLAKNDKYDIYVQQIVDITPAHSDGKVKILPAYGQRGSEMFLLSFINNLRIISPDVFIPICDSFLLVRDGLHKLDYSCKLMPYVPIDSIGVPDTSEDILDKACKIFTMSNYGKKALEDDGYKNVVSLYHGVNTNLFKPIDLVSQIDLKTKYGFKAEDEVFLTVGRNFSRKRHMRLIEAIAQFNMCNSNVNTKFFFHCSDSGTIPMNLKSFVKRMAKNYNVKMDNVIFSEDHKLGEGKTEKEIVEMFQMADYCISATSGEGFGIPTIEAMACNKLVIIPDNSANTELIGKNNERGILVGNTEKQNSGYGTQQPLVNINKLKEAIEDVLQNNYEDKKSNARAFVQENCNWDLIALQLEREIENV